MLEVFAIRLAAGFALALLPIPRGAIEPRFYRLHLTIASCFLTVAAVFAWQRSEDSFWLPFGLGFVATLFGVWAWSFEEYAFARYPALLAAPLALLASLNLLAAADPLRAFWDDLSAAWLLGLTTTAMLLGHWYLIAPNLTLVPLVRLHQGLFVSLVLRAVVVGVYLGSARLAATSAWDTLTWLWLMPRVLAGLLGAAVLAWMARRAAEDSTQAATGILYVATIFVFIGELTDQLLRQHLRSEP